MAIAVICCAVLFGMLQIPSLAEEVTPYTILRVEGEVEIDGQLNEVAWNGAPDVGKFQFPWYESGAREQTVAKLLWDDENLYVSFLCEDAHIWAEAIQRDGPVYRDDCVEVFAAPNQAQPETYFNIEMNVLGIFLDQYRPGGPGKKMEGEWNGEGIRIATSIAGSLNDDEDEDQYWVLEAAIPLKNYARAGGCLASGPQPLRGQNQSAVQPVGAEPDGEAQFSSPGRFRSGDFLVCGQSVLEEIGETGWPGAALRGVYEWAAPVFCEPALFFFGKTRFPHCMANEESLIFIC